MPPTETESSGSGASEPTSTQDVVLGACLLPGEGAQRLPLLWVPKPLARAPSLRCTRKGPRPVNPRMPNGGLAGGTRTLAPAVWVQFLYFSHSDPTLGPWRPPRRAPHQGVEAHPLKKG